MKGTLLFLLAVTVVNTNLNAAEAGMPQLDPKYWASQTFWLILVFTILYFTLSKIFIPKIKENLDIREKKIIEGKEILHKSGFLLHRYGHFWSEEGAHSLGNLDAPWLHAILKMNEIERYLKLIRPYEYKFCTDWIKNCLNKEINSALKR